MEPENSCRIEMTYNQGQPRVSSVASAYTPVPLEQIAFGSNNNSLSFTGCLHAFIWNQIEQELIADGVQGVNLGKSLHSISR